MSDISDFNVKLCKSIYNYITPIIIIYEENKFYIQYNQNIFAFALLIDMRNTVCHNILNENILRKMFVNMVLFYQFFHLDLFEKYKKIQDLWEKIEINDKIFKLCTNREIPNNEITLQNRDIFIMFYNDFKELLKFLHNGGRIFLRFGNISKTDIKLILKYGSPIILWYENVKKKFQNENKSDLLFQISRYTRHLSCHMLSLMREENLKPLLANICIIYLAFGVDLYGKRKKVRDLLRAYPSICTFVNENMRIEVGVETQFVDIIKVIYDIQKVLINKFNPWNKEYFLFGKYLHYFVSTKIKNNANFTKVYTDFKNVFGTNIKLDRDIFKLVSPLFVWIRVVDNLPAEGFDIDQQFYRSLREKRTTTINYFVNYKFGMQVNQEIFILFELTKLHLPIKDFFTGEDIEICEDNLTRIQYYYLFKELVEHSEFNENDTFSCSFIFKYNHIGNEIHSNICDVFNFSGIFVIFINYFEKFPIIITEFYIKVENCYDQIINYFLNKIQMGSSNNSLLDIAIKSMKSIFSDFRKINPSNYDIFHIVFSQLYYHIVTSNLNN